MPGILALATLFFVLVISMLVTKVATIALVHTGLSREAARFQARSAYTGAGFTTTESEQVVAHPVRRRIIMILMLLGNAGIVTGVATLILGFAAPGGMGSQSLKVGLLLAGLVALWGLAASTWVDQRLSRVIDRGLRRYTSLDTRDYAGIMQLFGDYSLAELAVRKEDWTAGKTLAQLKLRDEGVIVLGIKRAGGGYLGAPNGDSRVEGGDTLLLYGLEEAIASLDRRRASMTAELRHDLAVGRQDEILLAQEEEQERGRVGSE